MNCVNLLLLRFAYNPESVHGKIVLQDWHCFTMERPWILYSQPGGKPFVSCVPDGDYELIPYTRQSNGEKCFAMVNPSLGVYFMNADRPVIDGKRSGRYKTLIHGRANYVANVKGCAAVGEKRLMNETRNEFMVTKSGATMAELRRRIGWHSGHTLTIRQAEGAVQPQGE